jgi:hypothetical protein
MSDEVRAKQHDVFVSYKREDDTAREVLCEALAARGYEMFWDAKLGIDYSRTKLRDRIECCKLVIVLWSAKAAQSDEVGDEASGAKWSMWRRRQPRCVGRMPRHPSRHRHVGRITRGVPSAATAAGPGRPT